MIPKFAIFYNDGSIVEGGGQEDEEITLSFTVSKKWLEAPIDGVQAVVSERADTCRIVWRGTDYYVMLPNETNGDCTVYSPQDDNLSVYHRTILRGMMKFGMCLGDNKYRELMKRVKQYEGIPRDCDRKSKPDEGIE